MTVGIIWVMFVFSPVLYHAGRATSGALARGVRSLAPQRSTARVPASAGVAPTAAAVVPVTAGVTATS